MSTSETIQSYFNCLGQNQGWEAFLSGAMTFACFTSPIRRAVGKDAYLEATKGFFSMITALQVRGLVVDGKKVCALTRYELKPPVGPGFDCDVAEVFEIQEGKIVSLEIYFDSAPFPKQGK